jgi:hypothetical protein
MWVKLTRNELLLEVSRHEGGYPSLETATPAATLTSRASNGREALNRRVGEIRPMKEETTRHGCVR